MSARTKARKRAVEALFAADIRSTDAVDQLAAAKAQAKQRQNQDDIFGYAEQLVAGVTSNLADIDTYLEAYSEGWSVERMPFFDRAVMRVAVWEILYNPEVSDPVAIAEAVALAKEYSTDESPSFVNGLLARISATKSAI